MVVTLALAGSAFRPQAGPVSPDPADCFFTPLTSTSVLQFQYTTANLVALSGDGKTALLFSRFQSDFQLHISILQEEFFIRDGKQRLLTHYDTSYYDGGGGPVNSSGPSWGSVALPFDGSFVAANSFSNNVSQANLLTLPDVTGSVLPLKLAISVSGNGLWVIGFDATGQLVRLHRQDGHAEVLVKKSDGVAGAVYGVSYTGDLVYGRLSAGVNPPVFRWTATEGFSKPSLPEDFSPTSMDASGEFLAGQVVLPDRYIPAYWSLRGGLVKLTSVLNGVDSSLGHVWHISGDGKLLFGTLGVPVVWTRDGSVYPLSSLIRGLDLKGNTCSSVDVISYDGHTIGGSYENLTDYTQGLYLAGLALPGEGPHIALQPTAAGGRTLDFHAKTGFHYQVQSSSSLGSWVPTAIPEITGDDADHAVALPAGSEVASFFRLVVNP